MAIYMKFGSVVGQVTTDGFKDWIELHSFNFGIGRGVTSGAGGARRESSNPSISEIAVTKLNDASSSKLYEDAVAGSFDSKVEIKMTSTTKNKVDTFMTYELENCGLSGFSVSSGGENPSEALSLNFTKITITPSPLDDKGVPKKGDVVSYDLSKLTKS